MCVDPPREFPGLTTKLMDLLDEVAMARQDFAASRESNGSARSLVDHRVCDAVRVLFDHLLNRDALEYGLPVRLPSLCRVTNSSTDGCGPAVDQGEIQRHRAFGVLSENREVPADSILDLGLGKALLLRDSLSVEGGLGVLHRSQAVPRSLRTFHWRYRLLSSSGPSSLWVLLGDL